MKLPAPSCLALLALLAAATGGCASGPPLRTPSGNPEIVVHRVGKSDLLPALRAGMAQLGYREMLSNEGYAVYQKPCDDFDTAFFHGSGWHSSADLRVTCYLLQQADVLRVLTDLEVVTEPGTPDEKTTPAPRGHDEAHLVQRMFERLQADMVLLYHERLYPDAPPRPSEPVVWTGGTD